MIDFRSVTHLHTDSQAGLPYVVIDNKSQPHHAGEKEGGGGPMESKNRAPPLRTAPPTQRTRTLTVYEACDKRGDRRRIKDACITRIWPGESQYFHLLLLATIQAKLPIRHHA